jgi:hypothetical protein
MRRGRGRTTPCLWGAAFAIAALPLANPSPAIAQQPQQQPRPALDALPWTPFQRGNERSSLMSPLVPPPGPADPNAVVPPGADLAFAAFQAGRYLEAFRRATDRIAANPSDAAAMTLLGELLSQGLGVARDEARALQWYDLATARGDVNARFAAAMMRLTGRGGPRDETRGRALLAEAAAAGHGPAAFNLALPLLAAGGEAELAQAVPLLKQAAEREIGDAQHALAILMLEGRGVPKDEEGGADMMQRAALNGSLAGEVEFAILQFTGRGIGRDEQAAARGFARAAARGNAIAQNRLARILLQGRWLRQDRVRAMGWHLLAKAQGLQDEVLEAELQRLLPADREKAEVFAQEQLAVSALTKPDAAAQSTGSEFRR